MRVPFWSTTAVAAEAPPTQTATTDDSVSKGVPSTTTDTPTKVASSTTTKMDSSPKYPSLMRDPPTKVFISPISQSTKPATMQDKPKGESLQNAQARITELEDQISVLTLRATSAVERATDLENALKRLTAASKDAQTTEAPTPTPAEPSPKSTTTANAPQETTASRFARLLTTRYNANASGGVASQTPNSAESTGSDAALRDALSQEQTLRKAAENAAAKTNSELEELTAQLFEQANEMVASERKARAKLESRVEMLEKRDGDKAKRLELLEMRIQRVERVRSLLDGPKAS